MRYAICDVRCECETLNSHPPNPLNFTAGASSGFGCVSTFNYSDMFFQLPWILSAIKNCNYIYSLVFQKIDKFIAMPNNQRAIFFRIF